MRGSGWVGGRIALCKPSVLITPGERARLQAPPKPQHLQRDWVRLAEQPADELAQAAGQLIIALQGTKREARARAI